MNLYRLLARPLLFRMDPERAHHLAVETCRAAGNVPPVPQISRACLEFKSSQLECEVAGLKFANPIGLAAGWDKSGRALRMLDALGFGFAEIGSISARPSRGNPGKRLFRLPEDGAIVVNYGLPNEGAEVIAKRLAAHRPRHPLGVNIVKTNDGPDAPACSEDAILADYETSVRAVHRHASYLMLNLSCPNAKDGVDHFAQPERISRLLSLLAPIGVECPVFVKAAPNPDPAAIDRLIAECDPFPFVRGLSFNLPPGKPASLRLQTSPDIWRQMPGAVSGRPAALLLNACLGEAARRAPRGRFALIASGGVFTAEDAWEKIRLGASLVQLYTALIYEGPGVVRRINRGLCEIMRREGVGKIAEAVGAGVKG